MAGRRLKGTAWAAAGAGAALGAALMLVRETDAARIEADPEWGRLNRPLDGRELEVRSSDGTRLHVESFGRPNAPTIVLVHGWMCALRLWRYQLDSLAEDFHVITYDARGHGRSGPGARDDYSIEALAEDLHSVLEACAPKGAVTLGGHSMGAMTIAAWARDHTDDVRNRVRGAALLSTGLDGLITESLVLRAPARFDDARQRIGHAVLCSQAPLDAVPAAMLHRGVRFVALSPRATPGQVAFCERMFVDCQPDVRGGCGGTLSSLALGEAIASLDVPTVVVSGKRDRLTPPSHSRRFAAALPELVELVEVPGAGHMTPVEAPAEVTAALRTAATA
jgi:pimeloyl-ACP methyl ester carboxylesterase